MKIVSQSPLIRLDSRGCQDSDDGYTSLNALDNLKPQPYMQENLQQKKTKKRDSKTHKSRRPHSIASSKVTSSTSSFDDERTLVCTEDKDTILPLDGMYRLKVKSTTSTINSTTTTQFHGNKRLVRKYRMKRREGLTDQSKTASLDREQRQHTEHNNHHQHQRERLRRGETINHNLPCRLVTMLVV